MELIFSIFVKINSIFTFYRERVRINIIKTELCKDKKIQWRNSMQKLNTINCEEIMTQPLKPIEFVMDNLITQGLFILAGAPKIGKSWLALDICLSVANSS